jgi:predicted AlkP superfamily pyrophosphatase or phosphodiesterase
VREIDALIGTLDAGLKALGQPANLVIVSDHGMRAIEPEHTVFIQKLLPPGSFRPITFGPFATIDAVPGREEDVARALLAPNPNMQCWRKADMPARFHYGANPRVAAFLCLARAGAEVMLDKPPTNKGDHGYDPDDPDMTGLFLVNGPAFRRNASIPAKFDNVDLYPMLAAVIGVPAIPGDGNPETLRPALRAIRE